MFELLKTQRKKNSIQLYDNKYFYGNFNLNFSLQNKQLHHLTRTRKGKEFFTKFFENREKDLNIRGEIKVHLDSIKSNKLKYKEVKNLFIDILCKAKFSRLEIINSLNIKLSNDKFHRIKNQIPPSCTRKYSY